MFRSVIFAAFAATTIATQSSAEAFEGATDPRFAEAYAEAAEARSACLEAQYRACFDMALPLAQTGNPVAQNLVGIYYYEEAYDPVEYLYWVNRAGGQGYGKALYNLGDFFVEDHEGYAPNLPIAMGYFRAAADQGYLLAYQELGWYYLNGDAAVRDYDRARTLIAEAEEADPGNPYYARLRADMAYFGLGEQQDVVRALALYERAAAGGEAYAQYSAGYQYYYGEGVEVDDLRAYEYLQAAADNEYPAAFGLLAEGHYFGYFGQVDYDRSFAVAQRGHELGDAFAGSLAGYMLIYGEGTAQDFDAARATLQLSFERGNLNALHYLGDMAYYGYGQDANFEQALSIYHQVIERDANHRQANYSVGYMMMRGEGTPQDLAGSVPYLETAIAARYEDAILEGAVLFGHPDYSGPHTDPVRAMSYCIYLTGIGFLTNAEAQAPAFAACDHLQNTLTRDEMLEAADLATALEG